MSRSLYNSLMYGMFMVATKDGDRVNGCITNTCIQVALNPTRVALACSNTNLTCEMIRRSGELTVSVLDDTCTFETIRHFGLQSGRNVDKFDELPLPRDTRGIPYLNYHACEVLMCHVVESYDLGSHTLFIAEIDEMLDQSENAPLTYIDYQTKLKK